jgi:hypothetical protein
LFVGIIPVLISRQDWTGTTTLLRGILAWPALFLIAALGLTTLARVMYTQLGRLITRPLLPRFTEIVFLTLLLTIGSLNSIYNYFFIWATTYNRFSDHPPYMARYLNAQTDQMTLVPLQFYGESVVNFLLQARYPNFSNIDADELRRLLESGQPVVYILPAHTSAESIFVLLVPAGNDQGAAYLLPPLTLTQVEALTSHSRTTTPLITVLDSEQESIAHVYPLSVDAPFLPRSSPDNTSRQPLQANFNNNILLTDYQVTPPTVKPGETATLSLNWQAQRPIDGDYYLFIHLFDLSSGQRHGQVNIPLTGVLFNAHRWPVGLTVPDIHYFTLPPDAPEGVYRFEVGLYHGATLERLPVIIDGQSPNDRIILGKIHVWQQPPAPPQYPLADIQFGDSIALLGADVGSGLSLQPGQTLAYQLHWQALTPIAQDYVVFTHLLDAEGNIQAQQDTPPQQGRYPTSWWDAGEVVIDPYALSLPPDLAPGSYTLRVGLYEPETGRRLSLQNQPRDFVDLPNLITVQ